MFIKVVSNRKMVKKLPNTELDIQLGANLSGLIALSSSASLSLSNEVVFGSLKVWEFLTLRVFT